MKKIIHENCQLVGNQLDKEDRAYVLTAYVHRFTGNHKPNWANKAMPNGEPYEVQFKDDEDWLNHTYFAINRKGKLDKICKE
jgi:hypothetical protein